MMYLLFKFKLNNGIISYPTLFKDGDIGGNGINSDWR